MLRLRHLLFLSSISMSVGQVGNLLEHTVGNLDPLYIVSLVPDGLEIPRYVPSKFIIKELSYRISCMTETLANILKTICHDS